MVYSYIHIIVFCSYSPHPLYWLSSSTKYFPLIFYLRNLTYAERWKKWYYSLPSKIYYLTRFSSLVCLLDTGLYVFWFLLFFFSTIWSCIQILYVFYWDISIDGKNQNFKSLYKWVLPWPKIHNYCQSTYYNIFFLSNYMSNWGCRWLSLACEITCCMSMRTWVQISSSHVQSEAWLCISATPVLWGVGTGGLLGLASHQPSFRFNERPCLKKIRQRVFMWIQGCTSINTCTYITYTM